MLIDVHPSFFKTFGHNVYAVMPRAIVLHDNLMKILTAHASKGVLATCMGSFNCTTNFSARYHRMATPGALTGRLPGSATSRYYRSSPDSERNQW